VSSIFTISLDFELHWGGFEKWPLRISDSKFQIPNSHESNGKDYAQYFLNTRHVIPEMLGLFENSGVHVTWATVGMLLQETKDELLRNSPSLKPSYKERKLSAYHYIREVGIGENEEHDPFHYAPSLVRQIISTPYQELGTHTFAHYYCNEEGQSHEQFRADLQAAQRAAEKFGRRLKSLVFPRNQFNDDYLRICAEEGITSVRSNPLDWFWEIKSTLSESGWKRLNRGMDAYLPIGEKNTYPLNSLRYKKGYPICIPASRLLRPYRKKELFLNDLKIRRIKSEMQRAAQRGEVYHLWWHPHNFGNFPEQSLEALKEILKHYIKCRETFGMISLNMGEISEKVIANSNS
jgi:peptidoglycan/xylan/chitin deacetylase (PgdA/CDA1 family)